MNLFRTVLLVVLLGGVVAFLGVVGFAKLNQPLGPSQPTQLIDVPPGTPFAKVSHILHRRHLLGQEWFFKVLGRVQQVDRKIIPGEYELHAGMRPTELLAKLVNGEVYQHSITIPEGYSVVQIGDMLEQKNLAEKQAFLSFHRDREFIQSLNIDAPSLEGYLFPDTYRFPRYTPPESLIRTFVNRFHEMVTPEMQEQAKNLGMTLQEVLTLASVIEKETGLATERSLVSGVFHNRLRRNIPLQSDPTVIYALEYFDGNIRKADLSVDSPYNTYRVRGLPPGPIANPGLAAIQAALYPTPSNFVYFVSRNDGSHQFSATLAEHNKAVDKYQRRLRPKQSS
ncbi:MAG: endolytic transglycosylase MltG [Nitrospirales bacterium]